MEQSTPEPKKIRVFIALKIPREWEEPLQELQKTLQSRVSSDSIRWIDTSQIHLTLRFLGYVAHPLVDGLKKAIGAAADGISPFLIHYDGLGCFPRVKDPRIIWAGLKCDDNRLGELYRRLNGATARIGEPPEDRPFKPHLTLARVKNLNRKLIPRLEQALGSISFSAPIDWRVKEVLLMQSHLSSQGARYEALHVAPLSQRLPVR